MRTATPTLGETQAPAVNIPLQDALKAMEAAMLCLEEGNISGVGRILYRAIKAARQQ